MSRGLVRHHRYSVLLAALVVASSALTGPFVATQTAAGAPGNGRLANTGASSDRWTGQTSPKVSDNGNFLVSISCPQVGFCMAVGADTFSGTAPVRTFIVGGNGTDWSVFATTSLTSTVSCSSRTFCLTNSPRPYVWNGTDWSAGEAPTGGVGRLSCAPDGYCLGLTHSATKVWDGSAWTKVATFPLGLTTPGPTGGGNFIKSLSCADSTYCVAVGELAKPVRNRGGKWFTQGLRACSCGMVGHGLRSSCRQQQGRHSHPSPARRRRGAWQLVLVKNCPTFSPAVSPLSTHCPMVQRVSRATNLVPVLRSEDKTTLLRP